MLTKGKVKGGCGWSREGAVLMKGKVKGGCGVGLAHRRCDWRVGGTAFEPTAAVGWSTPSSWQSLVPSPTAACSADQMV